MGGRYKSAAVPGSSTPVSKLDQRGTIGGEADQDAAVRRRVIGWEDISAQSETGATAFLGQTPVAPPPAQPLSSPEQKEPEKLVVESWVDLETAKVADTVDAIRNRVLASGGRMVSENVSGSGPSASSAALEFRVPPAQAMAVTTWLGTLGHVTNRRVMATDVGKTLFDQELALKNLELTMERLQKLAAQSGPIADLLTIEKEMTRVRGEIETVKGQHRWLINRVELATITVSIRRSGDEPEEEYVPEARVYPGPQLAVLTLLEPGMRQRTRVGGGASIRLHRYATFDFNIFPRGDGGDSRAVLATFGAAMYSSYLRDGRRRYLNPYIGARIGYGYLSGEGMPVVAAELGVELYKHKYLLVDSAVRAIGFADDNPEAAFSAMLGVAVPF
jgi:hypothetical protein